MTEEKATELTIPPAKTLNTNESNYEEVIELRERFRKPFDSPEEASMAVSQVLARVLEHAVDRFTRIAARSNTKPQDENYWLSFHELVDAGLKIVNMLKVAYSWDDLSKKYKKAIEDMEQLKTRGLITGDQFTELKNEADKIDEAIIIAKSKKGC